MHLVNNIEELENLHSYKNYKIGKKYTSKFPALASFEPCDGGLGGSYYNLHVIEIPENFDFDSFVAGVNAEPKVYGENIFIKK
jgi:hypothetical protein